MEGWQDAEAAVDFLKRSQAGRATFLPLDSLRPGRASDVPRWPRLGSGQRAGQIRRGDPAGGRAGAEPHPGRGRSADCPPPVGPSGGATLVTLDGEIVRPSGSVTGGSENKAKDSGMLSRARTLRELPPQIEAGTT